MKYQDRTEMTQNSVQASVAVVFGEVCVDLLIQALAFHSSSDVFRGEKYQIAFGGRGANQAIATRRLGLQTRIVGRVGDDHFGEQLIQNLAGFGVKTDRLVVDLGNSPLAIIGIQHDGEFKVLSFVEGVNRNVNLVDVERFASCLADASIVLFQLGYPVEAIAAAAKVAKAADVLTILDPAPAEGVIPVELYSSVDIITPNEREASPMVGFPVFDINTATAAAQILHEKGSKTVVVKLGVQGALCSTLSEIFFEPAIPVA